MNHPASATTRPAGAVERLDTDGIEGWVSRTGDDDVEISVNGRTVASTFPSQVRVVDGLALESGFSRQLKALWRFMGEGDYLEVRYAGATLPISGHGDRWVCDEKRESTLPKLLKRLDAGYVFNKYGNLRLSLQANQGYQDWTLQTYEELQQHIKAAIGCDSFAIYGTMLGAVREGNFIGHDNDFDMVYVSKFSSPKQVKREFVQLCGYLLDEGYWLHVKKTHTWVRRRGTRQKMDIFFAWFDDDGLFQLSYGYHGDPVDRSAFAGKTPYRLGAHELMLPSGSPRILEQTFGPGWRTPDQGFSHHSATRRIDKRYFIGKTKLSKLYWRQFYRDNNVSEGSPFAKFLAERINPESTIIEIGCGTGRDAIFFSEHGHSVYACDRAEEGIKRATMKAREEELSTTFAIVDADKEDQLSAFLASAPRGNQLVVYMRFFLHSIPEKTQESILDAVARVPTRLNVALEFRTDQDASQPKVYGEHYRRFIKPSEVTNALTARGFEITYEKQGTGLSPFGEEDPHLARILAVKP
jgi:hypothetical protein